MHFPISGHDVCETALSTINFNRIILCSHVAHANCDETGILSICKPVHGLGWFHFDLPEWTVQKSCSCLLDFDISSGPCFSRLLWENWKLKCIHVETGTVPVCWILKWKLSLKVRQKYQSHLWPWSHQEIPMEESWANVCASEWDSQKG